MYRMTAATALRLKADDRPSQPVALRPTPDRPGEYDAVAERLYLLLHEVYQRGGFTAVVKLTSEAQKKLALNNRSAVDAEGWIA